MNDRRALWRIHPSVTLAHEGIQQLSAHLNASILKITLGVASFKARFYA
jgi:hypothetical protein